MSQLQFKQGTYEKLYTTDIDKDGQSITVINSKINDGDICFAKFSDSYNNGALLVKIDGALYNLTNIPGPAKQPLVGQGANKGSIYSSQVSLSHIDFYPTTDTDSSILAGKMSSSNQITYLKIGFNNNDIDKHYEGRIHCYSQSGYYTEISTGNDIEEAVNNTLNLTPLANNNYFYLPAGPESTYARAIWKQEDSRAGVGSTTQPVYVDNYGQVKKSIGYELFADLTLLDPNTESYISRGTYSAGGLFVYNTLEEATTEPKETRLTLGNTQVSGSVNRYGIIELYDTQNKKNIIKTQEQLSNDSVFYLPNAGNGTAYGVWVPSLTSTIGNVNLPVYVNNKGELLPCNELLHAFVSSGNNLTIDAGNSTITAPIINSIKGIWKASTNPSGDPYLELSINGKSEIITIDPASDTIGGIVTTNDQTFKGNKTFQGNLFPAELWGYNLGSPQLPWSDIYAAGFHIVNDNGLSAGDFEITGWSHLTPGESVETVLSLGNHLNKQNSVNGAHGTLKLFNEIGGSVSIQTDNSVKSSVGILHLPTVLPDSFAVWISPSTESSASDPVYIGQNYEIKKCKKYAGGTAVTINGIDSSEKNVEFYAPITSGSSDGLVLISTFQQNEDGTVNTTPRWILQQSLSAGIDANTGKNFSEYYETKAESTAKYDTTLTYADERLEEANTYTNEKISETTTALTETFTAAISSSEENLKSYAEAKDGDLKTELESEMDTLQTSLEEVIDEASQNLLEKISETEEKILGSTDLAEKLDTIAEIATWIEEHGEAAADLVQALGQEEDAREAEDKVLDTKINVETENREQQDGILQQAINSETSNRTVALTQLETTVNNKIDQKVQELNDKIAAEATIRNSEDATLDAKISATRTALEKADENLTIKLAAEEATRIAQDNALTENLNKEIQRAEQKETEINDKLTEEIERATIKEDEIRDQLLAEISRSTEIDDNFGKTSFAVSSNSGLSIEGSKLGDTITLAGVSANEGTVGMIDANAQSFNGQKTFNSGAKISAQLILGTALYGADLPTTGLTTGQIFFKLI